MIDFKIYIGLLSIFIAVFYFFRKARRRHLEHLISSLKAKYFNKTFWFEQNGVVVLLYETDTYAARSLKDSFEKARKNNFLGAYDPHFKLIIPLESSPCVWDIAVRGHSTAEKLLTKLFPANEVSVDGKIFRVQGALLQNRIELAMPSIATRWMDMMDDDTSLLSLTCRQEPKFYQWRIKYGYFVELPLPEGIHREPNKVRKIVEGTFEILNELHLKPRRF